jgi:hypothetical protein
MIRYDSEVIDEFAFKLYQRARWVAFSYALVGFFVGAGLAGAANEMHMSDIVIGVVFIVSIAIGAATGRQKAFALKLQAQQALCQAQIERNTRADGMVSLPKVRLPEAASAQYDGSF